MEAQGALFPSFWLQFRSSAGGRVTLRALWEFLMNEEARIIEAPGLPEQRDRVREQKGRG